MTSKRDCGAAINHKFALIMEPDFWHERWQSGRLGFHQEKVNSRLRKFWHAFTQSPPAKGDTVLVPLSGKSLDMLWLADAGYHVIGVEISDLACRDFFVENELVYRRIEEERFIKYSGENITLLCGDFFDLAREDLHETKLVYDRAALIALPKTMRQKYVAHLTTLLPPAAKIFLIGMDYDEAKMKGPPFAVPQSEVRALFAADFAVEIISESSGPDIVGNLADRGLDTLDETVYKIKRRVD